MSKHKLVITFDSDVETAEKLKQAVADVVSSFGRQLGEQEEYLVPDPGIFDVEKALEEIQASNRRLLSKDC